MGKMNYDELRFAWTDLETTGLSPAGGSILEIACVITDRHFNVVDKFHCLVDPGEDVLADMNDYVTKMHTENGLLKEIRENRGGNALSVTEADRAFSAFLKNCNNGEPNNVLLAGNSLAGVDIPFMRYFLPKSDGEVHYRYLDVTSFRIAAGVWFGNDTEYKKENGHRAFDDIVECIDEFKFVAKSVFKQELEMT